VGRALLLAALPSLALGTAHAGPDTPTDPADEHPARAQARAALQGGRTAEAREHLAHVLRDHPASASALADLARASTDAPEIGVLALDRWATAVVDAKGRLELPRELRELKGTDDGARREVEKARSRAVADVLKQMQGAKGVGADIVVGAYDRLLDDLLDGAPVLEAEVRSARAKAREKVRVTAAELVEAVEKGAGRNQRPEHAAARLRLGRALIGLAAQVRQKATDAPDRGADGWRRVGEKLEREAVAALAERQMAPLTLAQLEAMDGEAIRAFNEAHTDLATPGRSVTPKGRYEIVTASGHGVLLAATRWAEVVHDRLARWFGGDPFEDKRGLIRIVSSWAEMDREDAPFWWAKGFQQGAVTRIHFALDDANELVRTLAHELTHRFDGTFHPGMPAWMVEGRAVYAEGAFEQLDTPDMDPRYADGSRVNACGGHYRTTWWLGNLIQGTPEDYRDNYTAGHALWTYLATWPPGEQGLFAKPLAAWLGGMTGGERKPLADFVARFCDGKDGRPADFDTFAGQFGDFLDGVHAEVPPAWVRRYRWVSDTRPQPLITDAPALSRERAREPPGFGQDHLVEAARALALLGEDKVAIALLGWGLTQEEMTGTDLDLLLALLVGQQARPAAAAILRERRRHGGLPDAGVAARVDPTALGRPLLTGLLRQWADAVALRDGQGALAAAARYARQHDRVASAVGAPLLDRPAAATPDVLGRGATRLDIDGWQSEPLAGFDRSPEPDRWTTTPEGDLVVGRKDLATAGLLALPPERCVFVRSQRTARADVRVRFRMHFLTPLCEGAIVVGHRRFDRNVQVRFEAGERARPGAPDVREVSIKRAAFHVTTLRPFDHRTSGWRSGGMVTFEEKNVCQVVVDVQGAQVTVWVDGVEAGSLADAEGAPVDGAIGFAMMAGAVRIEAAVLEDLVGPPFADGRAVPTPSLGQPRRPMGSWVEGRVLEGLATAPFGRVVLWLPRGAHTGGTEFLDLEAGELAALMARVRRELDEAQHGAVPTLIQPATWPEAARQAAAAAFLRGAGPGAVVLEHGEAGDGDTEDGWGRRPVFLFVDPRGIVRCTDLNGWPGLKASTASHPNPWYRWMRYTRGW
jgi:hypothetical protein